MAESEGTEQHLNYAHLDEGRLTRLRQLEEELGTYLLAVEPDSPWADLSDDQLRRLKAAERELGVILLARKQPPEQPSSH
jgi:hypothetical protein